MRETCDTNGNSQIKRVSVRTGGAGHAHSGVVRGGMSAKSVTLDGEASPQKRLKSVKSINGKIVKLGS